MNKPLVELRKFKHSEFASHETHCYEAEVWVNGKKGFHASNDGHGGCDMYDDLDNGTARKTLEAYVKTLPDWELEGLSGKQTLEMLIGEQIDNALIEKDARKILRNAEDKVVGIDGKDIWSWKFSADPFRQLQAIKAKYPKVTIINGLPKDEALKIVYRALKE